MKKLIATSLSIVFCCFALFLMAGCENKKEVGELTVTPPSTSVSFVVEKSLILEYNIFNL